MTLSRRDAMIASTSAVAGLAFAAVTSTEARAQDKPQEAWPDHLVEKPISPAFPVPLPLMPDGSAPEHRESEAGPIVGRLMWHTADKKAPPGEPDYRKMAIKVDTRGWASFPAPCDLPISKNCRAFRTRFFCSVARLNRMASSNGRA